MGPFLQSAVAEENSLKGARLRGSLMRQGVRQQADRFEVAPSPPLVRHKDCGHTALPEVLRRRIGFGLEIDGWRRAERREAVAPRRPPARELEGHPRPCLLQTGFLAAPTRRPLPPAPRYSRPANIA